MTAARTLAPALYSTTTTVLIVTPDAGLRHRLSEGLRAMAVVEVAATGAEALSELERRGARLVLLDRRLPDLHVDELVAVVERQFACTQVVLLDSASGVIEIPEELRATALCRRLAELGGVEQSGSEQGGNERGPVAVCSTAQARPAEFEPLPAMVGVSAAMRRVAQLVRAVAPHTAAVLVTGETGTGKELVAEAVHQLSPRRERAFVTVNCAAIPEALIEAELFGHTRGAFTGAVQSRLGKIHAAQGGTIFFDEIGELPLASQAKLLRFLESGEVQRLGASDVFRLDVRVVAATNVELEKKVERGEFRDDLFYRLSVFPIELEPLREREGDVLLLARNFLERMSGERKMRLTAESEEKLMGHRWPGNVRELRNVIERAFILATPGTVIAPEHLLLRKPCGSVGTKASAAAAT